MLPRRLWIALLPAALAGAEEKVSFATGDGARVCAEVFGRGKRAVVLAHGGRFQKESWRPQASILAAKGFRVLAIDFRGYGCSRGPGEAHHEDVLGAVRYLKAHGAESVSVVGGSFGAGAAGDASIRSRPGVIDRVVFLGYAPNLPADQLHSRSLFIVAREDSNGAGPRLPEIRAQYDRAPEPKELIVLEGSAHAQFLFQTEHRDRVMREISRFLQRP
ncbi:MAG: alpha/beta fold hydrolase [Bryobacteraceae bacterium]